MQLYRHCFFIFSLHPICSVIFFLLFFLTKEITWKGLIGKEGKKFKVSCVNKEDGTFEIEGIESPDMTKHVKWGLAKDDVTPQDIFRMTNEGPDEPL